jgi:hypothetical protein
MASRTNESSATGLGTLLGWAFVALCALLGIGAAQAFPLPSGHPDTASKQHVVTRSHESADRPAANPTP